MTLQIEGIIRNGKVELTSGQPPVDGTRVLVFLTDKPTGKPGVTGQE